MIEAIGSKEIDSIMVEMTRVKVMGNKRKE